MVPNSMFNISVTGRQAVLTDLEPDHIYNLSVTAGTGAGYGEPVTVQTSTCMSFTCLIPSLWLVLLI